MTAAKNAERKAAPAHVSKPKTHAQNTHAAQTKEELWEFPKAWTPPEGLPYVEPRPGMVNRWIAVENFGQTNDRNIARKFPQWRPVRVSDLPRGVSVPTMEHARYGEIVKVQGMILCEQPVELHEQRQRHFEERTKRQSSTTVTSKLRDATKDVDPEARAHYSDPEIKERTQVYGQVKTTPRRPELDEDTDPDLEFPDED